MRIKRLTLRNFRAYKDETHIEFGDLTAFVGPNDIGKSTILEALDIFFNEGKGVAKMDSGDVNMESRSAGDTEIRIAVVFDDLPKALTIDTSNPTSLADEYLLNKDGLLEVVKKYPNGGKEKVTIKANHPTKPDCAGLLLKKISELKTTLGEIPCADKSRSATIRRAIWDYHRDDSQLQETEIDVSKEDAKSIWDQLKTYMPYFALFQSDRKNSDTDNEIQDPLKEAVRQILGDPKIRKKLDDVAIEVAQKLKDVADRTLDKIREMNSEVANGLNPEIPPTESLKWSDVFKSVTISGDEGIPINKRGSGIKRLVLLNFFRAEAERRKAERHVPNIVYAIEEPETSQHPAHQRMLIDAFKDLSLLPDTQIFFTTHSPAIVKMLDFNNLRLLKSDDTACPTVRSVARHELPYPSLNEVNFLAFGESDHEYHNELYGFIESEGDLKDYRLGKSTRPYKQLNRDGTSTLKQVVLSEYIRHQIHHPENKLNTGFAEGELQASIKSMREFIAAQGASANAQ